MGGFFESIGNLFSGKGFRSNASLQEDDEERKKRVQQPVSSVVPAVPSPQLTRPQALQPVTASVPSIDDLTKAVTNRAMARDTYNAVNKLGTTGNATPYKPEVWDSANRVIQKDIATDKQVAKDAYRTENRARVQSDPVKAFGEYANPFGEKGLFTSGVQDYKYTVANPVVDVTGKMSQNIWEGREGKDWEPLDILRFVADLPVGMVRGSIGEGPLKLAEAVSGKRIEDNNTFSDLNAEQRLASLVDGYLDTGGLAMGTSKTMFKSLAPKIEKGLLSQTTKQKLKDFVTGSLIEGGEETVQTIAGDIADDGKYNSTGWEDLLRSFSAGVGGGVVFGGVGHTSLAVRNKLSTSRAVNNISAQLQQQGMDEFASKVKARAIVAEHQQQLAQAEQFTNQVQNRIAEIAQEADTARVIASQPVEVLGDKGGGIISTNQATAVKQNLTQSVESAKMEIEQLQSLATQAQSQAQSPVLNTSPEALTAPAEPVNVQPDAIDTTVPTIQPEGLEEGKIRAETPTAQQPNSMLPTEVSSEADTQEAFASPDSADSQTETTPDPTAETARQSLKEFDESVQAVDGFLASTGSSYARLVQKLKNNKSLTQAEQEIYTDFIQPTFAETARILNESKIFDVDVDRIEKYAPTGKAGGGVVPMSVDDVMASDFGFTQTREGKLSDAEIEAGALEAGRNAYVTARLVEVMSPEQRTETRLIQENKKSIDNLTQEIGHDQIITPSTKDKTKIEQANRKLIDTDEAMRKAVKKYATSNVEGDSVKYKEALAARAKAEVEVSAQMVVTATNATDAKIAEIRKDKSLSKQAKTALIAEAEAYLRKIENEASYQQSFVKTNILLQMPGRVADQVGKAVQSLSDLYTDPISKHFAEKSFAKHSEGKRLQVANRSIEARVWADPRVHELKKNYRTNTAIAKALGENRLSSTYRSAGTAVTDFGSRHKVSVKDTSRYFIAKAKGQGMTSNAEIASYVDKRIGTKEWNRVYDQFFNSRNAFSGIVGMLGTKRSNSPKIFKDISNAISRKIDMLPIPRKHRRNLADALRIPLIGFPSTVWNVGSRGMDHALLGMSDFVRASKVKGSDPASNLTRALHIKNGVSAAVNGGALYTLGALAGMNGMVTGGYPDDSDERARWREDGIQPYSLKVGEGKDAVYVELGRYIGPFAVPFALSALMGSGDYKDAPATVAGVLGQIQSNYGADGLVKTAESIVDVFKGDTTDIERLLPNITVAFFPFSGAIGSSARGADEYERETSGTSSIDTYVRRLVSKVPWLRESLPAQLDAFGNKKTSSWVRSFAPISGTAQEDDTPVENEIRRLYDEGHNVYPKGVEGGFKNATLEDADGGKVALSPEQQSALNEAVGKARQETTNLLVASDGYKQASDEDKAKLLKETYSATTASAKKTWATENGVTGVKEADNYYSDKLDDKTKQALIYADALTPTQREKWLEDTTNARDYHVGKYESALENGTVTEKDNSLQNKSGLHYKAVASQVDLAFGADASLRYEYNHISQKQLSAMADDNPLKQRLLAYDRARADQGVSLNGDDTTVPKYKENVAGSGTGSKASTKAVGLVDVTGGAGSGTGSGAKYASVSPSETRKLQVVKPSKAKRKSISVQKGVQL